MDTSAHPSEAPHLLPPCSLGLLSLLAAFPSCTSQTPVVRACTTTIRLSLYLALRVPYIHLSRKHVNRAMMYTNTLLYPPYPPVRLPTPRRCRRINVDQIMAHPYLAVPPPPKHRTFSLKGRPSPSVDPRIELRKVGGGGQEPNTNPSP